MTHTNGGGASAPSSVALGDGLQFTRVGRTVVIEIGTPDWPGPAAVAWVTLDELRSAIEELCQHEWEADPMTGFQDSFCVHCDQRR